MSLLFRALTRRNVVARVIAQFADLAAEDFDASRWTASLEELVDASETPPPGKHGLATPK